MAYQYPEELMFLKNRKAPQHHSDASFEGKWVVITGATSGIGLHTAFRFAKHQANLILVVRNEMNGRALQKDLIEQFKIHCECVIADFEDFALIENAALTINALKHPISILINNAGLHSTTFQRAKSGYEKVLMVNHLGSFYFTHLLMKSLLKNAHPRVIYVNSEGHRFAHFDPEDLDFNRRRYTGLRSYGASKSAQLLSVKVMAKRLGTKMTLIAMHPGDVKSNIGRNNGWLYRLFSKLIIQPILQEVEVASSALHYLALEPSLEANSGQFFHLTHPEVPAKHVQDEIFAAEVYAKTCAWVKLDASLILKEPV